MDRLPLRSRRWRPRYAAASSNRCSRARPPSRLRSRSRACALPVPQCVPPQTRAGATIYATPLRAEPQIDGVRDDWNLPDDAASRSAAAIASGPGSRGASPICSSRSATRPRVPAPGPGEMPYGDRVVLATEPSPEIVRGCCSAPARRACFARRRLRRTVRADARRTTLACLGAWQETADGLLDRVRVPLNLVGARACRRRDRRRSQRRRLRGRARARLGTRRRAGSAASSISVPSSRRCSVSSAARAGGSECSTRTAGCLSDAGSVEPREIDRRSASLVASAFRWALRRDDPPYPRELPSAACRTRRLRGALARRAGHGVVRQRAGSRRDRRGGRADRGPARRRRRRAARAGERPDSHADEPGARAAHDVHGAR